MTPLLVVTHSFYVYILFVAVPCMLKKEGKQ